MKGQYWTKPMIIGELNTSGIRTLRSGHLIDIFCACNANGTGPIGPHIGQEAGIVSNTFHRKRRKLRFDGCYQARPQDGSLCCDQSIVVKIDLKKKPTMLVASIVPRTQTNVTSLHAPLVTSCITCRLSKVTKFGMAVASE